MWRSRYPGGLSEVEETFAKAMVARATHRRRVRRAVYAAVLAAVVVVATGLGILLRTSLRETRRAEAAKLFALGRLELDAYPTAALAYSRKSLEVFDTPEARRFALEALSRGPVARVLALPSAPSGKFLDFSPRGDRLAVAGFTEDALVYPSDGGQPLALPGHPVTSEGGLVPAFASDTLLVTGLATAERLWFWSLPEGRKLRTIDLGTGDGGWLLRSDQLLAYKLEGKAWGGDAQVLVRSWRVSDLAPRAGWRVPAADFQQADFDARSGMLVHSATSGEIRARPLDAAPAKSAVVASGLGGPVWVWLRPMHDEVLSSTYSTGEYRLWPLQRATQKALCVLHGGENSVAKGFDRSGRWLVSLDRGAARAQLWDLEAPPGAAPTLLRAGSLDWGQGQARFEPTARWLATVHAGNVAFWPVGGARSLLLSPENGKFASVAFSPGGEWLASASFNNFVVRLWPMSPLAGRAPRDLLTANTNLNAAVFDSSGSTVMAVGVGSPVFFVLLAGGETREFNAFPLDSAAGAAAFDQTGRYAAAAPFFSRDDMKIVVWDRANDSKCEIPLREKNGPDGYEGGVWSLAFAPDGALYSAGYGGVRRWDVATGLGETVFGGADAVISLSRNGRVLAAVISSGPLTEARISSRVMVLDLFAGTAREIKTHGLNAVSVALDATGHVLVTSTPDGVIRVGLATGEEPHLLLADTASTPWADLSPDGRWVAAPTVSGSIRLWAVPDLSKPPFHTLPYPELMAKLRELTNLRVVDDAGSPTGYRLDIGPFPGWATVPEWNP